MANQEEQARDPYFNALAIINGAIAGVSRKKSGYGMSLKFDNAYMSANKAAELFCGTVLQCILSGVDADPKQLKMFPEDYPRLEFSAICSGPRLTAEEIAIPLSIPLDQCDIEQLNEFAFSDVKLYIIDSQPADEADETEVDGFHEEDAESFDDAFEDGTEFDDDDKDFYAQSLSKIGIKGAGLKHCKAAGIKTVGQLEAWRARKGMFWVKDLKGLRQPQGDEIEDLLVKAISEREKTKRELEKASA